MNILKELLTKLKDHDSKEICFKTGLSITTVNSLLDGRNANPTIGTVAKLQAFIQEKENELPRKN